MDGDEIGTLGNPLETGISRGNSRGGVKDHCSYIDDVEYIHGFLLLKVTRPAIMIIQLVKIFTFRREKINGERKRLNWEIRSLRAAARSPEAMRVTATGTGIGERHVNIGTLL